MPDGRRNKSYYTSNGVIAGIRRKNFRKHGIICVFRLFRQFLRQLYVVCLLNFPPSFSPAGKSYQGVYVTNVNFRAWYVLLKHGRLEFCAFSFYTVSNITPGMHFLATCKHLSLAVLGVSVQPE